jgi:hypothetical protein
MLLFYCKTIGMKRITIILLYFLLFSASCKKSNDPSPDTFEFFQQNLEADTKYQSLVLLFGEPDTDIGSGIHIYVYYLKDGSTIMIGYTDHIIYANHVDSNRQLLHVLF